MPGHANSPYWTAVDFDSEGEEDPSPSASHRVYLDPWDSEQYSLGRTETGDSSQAGEPVSASFYYVPTKSYESEEEPAGAGAAGEAAAAEYAHAHRSRRSRPPAEHPDMFNYGYDVMPVQRRVSVYNPEEAYYALQPLPYEPLYHPLPPPLPPPQPPSAAALYLPPPPRKRFSLPAPRPDYVMAAMKSGTHRRPSRYVEACERYAYETLVSEYGAGGGGGGGTDEWHRRRPALPKAAPDNFHLSRYGHLKIDYSCSWSSLDRLIRNQ